MTGGNVQSSVERYVTAERLGPYLLECGDDFPRAEALYVWNMRVAGAFHESLGIFEVVLRNALCEQLRTWHGKRPGSWLDDPQAVLDDRRIEQIEEAQRIISAHGKQVTEGRVTAELTLGFWRYLLARRYEHSLWTPYLRRAFPGMRRQRREEVYFRVDDLHTLRNRVAHHEPIHKYDLGRLHGRMIDVVSWVDHDMGVWLDSLSRVPVVLAARPA